MPSPFPGMDPFLESPDEWRGFHNPFITYLASQLNNRLPQDYVARIEERLYVLEDKRDIIADYAVSRRPENELRRPQNEKGIAVLERDQADPPQIMSIDPVEIREAYIEIVAVKNKRGVHDKREVVTVIELLSPTNKEGKGRQKYLRKQGEILQSGINLIEIDLLRAGLPTVAILHARLRHKPRYDYLVCLNRALEQDRVEYWPFTIRERLPRILVPLQAGRSDVIQDLQDAFDDTFDRGAYERMLDYTEPIVPPLPQEDADWARGILRTASPPA